MWRWIGLRSHILIAITTFGRQLACFSIMMHTVCFCWRGSREDFLLWSSSSIMVPIRRCDVCRTAFLGENAIVAERRHFRRFHDDSIRQIREVHPVSPRVVLCSREASAALTRTAIWVHEVSRVHMRARSLLITVEEELFSSVRRENNRLRRSHFASENSRHNRMVDPPPARNLLAQIPPLKSGRRRTSPLRQDGLPTVSRAERTASSSVRWGWTVHRLRSYRTMCTHCPSANWRLSCSESSAWVDFRLRNASGRRCEGVFLIARLGTRRAYTRVCAKSERAHVRPLERPPPCPRMRGWWSQPFVVACRSPFPLTDTHAFGNRTPVCGERIFGPRWRSSYLAWIFPGVVLRGSAIREGSQVWDETSVGGDLLKWLYRRWLCLLPLVRTFVLANLVSKGFCSMNL